MEFFEINLDESFIGRDYPPKLGCVEDPKPDTIIISQPPVPQGPTTGRSKMKLRR